jgi:hypothetical protein
MAIVYVKGKMDETFMVFTLYATVTSPTTHRPGYATFYPWLGGDTAVEIWSSGVYDWA